MTASSNELVRPWKRSMVKEIHMQIEPMMPTRTSRRPIVLSIRLKKLKIEL